MPAARHDPALEARLAAAIEPWLQHMTWRDDFVEWRERRIWQEKHQEANVKDVVQALKQHAGERLLDLGAGMGGLSVALLLDPRTQGLRLQAMDYNPDYARIARLRARRYGLDLPIVVAAGEDLPYPDEAFDAIACLDVLEHVGDVEAVLMEMYRVLAPGGVVLTTVPNRRAFRDPHYHLPGINWLLAPLAERIIEHAGRSKSGGPLQDRQEHSELNTFTWGQFRRLAEYTGFRVRDEVRHRIMRGEIRQLQGLRRAVLGLLRRTGLLDPIYRAYRYGWQGTYQVRLVKPR
ncbi:MAG TPA: class I SAM-dependent methyltransferase [Chloroflexia bacterium]|nr:class I SAM-dependent methyltransferase [Chloroflexia bacterium]